MLQIPCATRYIVCIGKIKSRAYMKKKSKAIGVNVTSIIFEEICSFSLFYTFIFARVQCLPKIIDIKKCFLCFLYANFYEDETKSTSTCDVPMDGSEW